MLQMFLFYSILFTHTKSLKSIPLAYRIVNADCRMICLRARARCWNIEHLQLTTSIKKMWKCLHTKNYYRNNIIMLLFMRARVFECVRRAAFVFVFIYYLRGLKRASHGLGFKFIRQAFARVCVLHVHVRCIDRANWIAHCNIFRALSLTHK